MKQYVGCRYSPGYAACPDLEQSRDRVKWDFPDSSGTKYMRNNSSSPQSELLQYLGEIAILSNLLR
jgi:5-methyltetrahydrofolate--homocysteine methyltransferase